MARQRLLSAMLVVGLILSLATTLQADTKMAISHSNRGAAMGLGLRIGASVVPPRCHRPPVHRHVAASPWRHRFVHVGPPVVVHPPVVRVVHPPVVRPPVIEPVPTVLVRVPPPLEQTTITVWITNSNGSKTSVRLTRQGTWYVGPRGEYYTGMPTNEQLRVVYGF